MLEQYLKPIREQPEEIRVDLHMHSTASDGTWCPSKLIEHVIKSGIGLFALTDHDATGNVEETGALAKANGLCFIPGVEVSSHYKERTYHLLGLGVSVQNAELQDILKNNRIEMEAKNDREVELLVRKYPKVSLQEYMEYANNPARGGWKSLNYVIDKGLCTNHHGYFSLFDGLNTFKDALFPHPGIIAEAIRSAGGCAILAHPGASFYDRDFRGIVSYMVSQGIQGVECYHPENSPEVTGFCVDFCKEKSLMITGGSDCHGEFVAGRCLGKPDVRLSMLSL